MLHYGDITKIHGYDLEPVDVVTGGSPCQDLSVAGKRAGLEGERSGLFMEQIRIVKEMRERDRRNGISDEFVRPRFLVWENVTGSLSSGKPKGGDFQAVLTEIIRIAEPNAPDVPLPKKWSKSGCIYDEMGRWSVAWRVHSAEFWGVPQRRYRVAVVGDFRGRSAAEVLFEREGSTWHNPQKREKREASAGDSEESVGDSGRHKVADNSLSLSGGHAEGQRWKRDRQFRQASRKGCADTSGAECDTGDISGSDIVCLEGNGTRPSHRGEGWSTVGVMYTLNSVEKHSVCCMTKNHEEAKTDNQPGLPSQ